jgi:Ca2+-dependent lipid-binding protein
MFTQSPYIKITSEPSCLSHAKTAVKRGTHPKWGEEDGAQILILIGARDTTLKLEVWSTNSMSPDERVGFAEIPLVDALQVDGSLNKQRVKQEFPVRIRCSKLAEMLTFCDICTTLCWHR